MKLWVLFVLFAVGTTGYLIKVPETPLIENTTPVGWVHVQKLILPLFENVCEVSYDPTIIQLSEEFDFDTASDNYLVPNAIDNMKKIKYEKGLTPKGEIFSEYNLDHLNEFRIIYEALFYAKNFDTFYKTACWARQNINCGIFVDAIYLAIMNRRDTEKLALPPPYELLPNYFVRMDYIVKAASLVTGLDEIIPSDFIRHEGNAYIVDANHTTNLENGDEGQLAYFMEDVGLNSYYYFMKLQNVPWFNTPDYVRNNRFGEYLYHMMKQFNARYNLERYSLGLPEIESINWNSLYSIPYDPMLIYSNGNEFKQRTSLDTFDTENKPLLESIEHNVVTIVTHMRDGGYNKSQIISHLMEILVNSEKSYEAIIRQILNKDATFLNSPPSVFGHYMTSLRDPMFWRWNKKIVDIIDDALKVLPTYTKNELYFPGVEVNNVEVKKIMTNYDNFMFDVTDALKTGEEHTNFQIKINQMRLNHKPFSVKVNVSSLVSQRGLMKIYLGPKILPGELAIKKNLFMLLDCSEVNLKPGSNLITRTSDQMIHLSEDFFSLKTIRKKVEDSEFGLDALPLKSIQYQIGFPKRLILPKGSSGGLAFQLFVFVAPYIKASIGSTILNAEFNKASLSPGFPLDLDVGIRQLLDLPNTFIKDVSIIHKANGNGNGKPPTYGGNNYGEGAWTWQDNNSEIQSDALTMAAKSELYKRKEKIDYSTKKKQYENKQDYTVQKTSTYLTEQKNLGKSEIYNYETTTKVTEFDDKYINKPINSKDTKSFKNVDSWTKDKSTEVNNGNNKVIKDIDDEVLVYIVDHDKSKVEKITDTIFNVGKEKFSEPMIAKDMNTFRSFDFTKDKSIEINNSNDNVMKDKNKNVHIYLVDNDESEVKVITDQVVKVDKDKLNEPVNLRDTKTFKNIDFLTKDKSIEVNSDSDKTMKDKTKNVHVYVIDNDKPAIKEITDETVNTDKFNDNIIRYPMSSKETFVDTNGFKDKKIQNDNKNVEIFVTDDDTYVIKDIFEYVTTHENLENAEKDNFSYNTPNLLIKQSADISNSIDKQIVNNKNKNVQVHVTNNDKTVTKDITDNVTKHVDGNNGDVIVEKSGEITITPHQNDESFEGVYE